MLPLATIAGMVLVLCSLSLLGTALAARQAQAAEERRRQGDDALSSAAQLVVDRLQTSHACLAPLPSSQWEPMPLSCMPANGPLDATAVLRVGEGAEAARLLEWQPGSGDARLRLQLDSAAGPQAGMAADAAAGGGRTGTFLLTLDPDTYRVLSLRRGGA